MGRQQLCCTPCVLEAERGRGQGRHVWLQAPAHGTSHAAAAVVELSAHVVSTRIIVFALQGKDTVEQSGMHKATQHMI